MNDTYKEKFMIKNIRDTGRDRISMSIDENREKDSFEVGAIMLHVPDISDNGHSHIPFDREQATALRDWLNDFLNATDLEERLTDG